MQNKNEKKIKVFLFGHFTKARDFAGECHVIEAPKSTFRQYQGCTIFTVDGNGGSSAPIYDLYVADHYDDILDEYSFGLYINKNFINSIQAEFKVFIYLDEYKNEIEKFRDQHKCIAIDFHAMKTKPSECLKIIPKLLPYHDEKIKSYEAFKKHSLFVMQIMIETNLPRELALVISLLIVKTHTYWSRPVYVELPCESKPELTETYEDIEDNNDNWSCSIF